MPVVNIIDQRSNKHNVDITAIFEDAWHDNSCTDATQFKVIEGMGDDTCLYLCIGKTTVNKAIIYANEKIKSDVTLYLYDQNSNNYVDYSYIDDDNNLVK